MLGLLHIVATALRRLLPQMSNVQLEFPVNTFFMLHLMRFLKHTRPIRINQLPVSAARWQLGTWICYAKLVKILKIDTTQRLKLALFKDTYAIVRF
jgi:hypothetical protein